MKLGVVMVLFPRNIVWTVVFVCSCQLVFLLNWISLYSREFSGYHAEAEGALNINRPQDHQHHQATVYHQVAGPLGAGDTLRWKGSPTRYAATAAEYPVQGGGKSGNEVEAGDLTSGKNLSSSHGPAHLVEGRRNEPLAEALSAENRHLPKNSRGILARKNGLGIRRSRNYGNSDAVGYSVDDLTVALRDYYFHDGQPTLDFSQFRFLAGPTFICDINDDSPEGVYLLVTVHSAPRHRPQRDAIRSTWGEITRDFDSPRQTRLVFVLGLPDNPRDFDAISREAELFRDLILGNFYDAYSNLTLKSLYGLHWASRYCNSSQYILKTDDDSYVDLLQTLSLLVDLKPSILGAQNSKSAVMRKGLWAVSAGDYPFQTYPAYCTGCAYVMSMNTVQKLLQVAPYVPLIPVEDVHVTGLLPLLVNQTCGNNALFPQWHHGPSNSNLCRLISRTSLGVHNVPFERMYTIHAMVKKPRALAHNLLNCTLLSGTG